jgi:hypothetical protein
MDFAEKVADKSTMVLSKILKVALFNASYFATLIGEKELQKA